MSANDEHNGGDSSARANAESSSMPQVKASKQEKNLTGTVLSAKFELLSFIGSGGMSEVYKARNVVTGKIIAVKILHKDKADDESTAQRLKQEAQAAGALKHPNILSIHDFETDESGTSFLVMDFVDGISLSDALKVGTLKIDRFLSIMQQVASALTHAHEHSVVHRDLKPSNIMLVNDGSKEQAMIVDFGLARLVSADSDAHRLTQTGELFGSPLYMSPEQCTGSPVGPRSDIYSFGCVMYEALSGKTPFQGDTVFDTIHRQINNPPPPLLVPDLEQNTKERLEGLILKCLAKSPQNRYQTATAIESELRSIQLSTGSDIASRIGNAWGLAQAKYQARKKSNVPLLVVGLFAVTLLSVISSFILLLSLKDYADSDNRLINCNELLNGYGELINHVGSMYRASEEYILDRQPDHLRTFVQYRAASQSVFIRLEALLKGQPKKLKTFRERKHRIEIGVNVIFKTLISLPKESGGFADFAREVPAFAKLAESLNKGQYVMYVLQGEESVTINKLRKEVQESQKRVLIVGVFTIALNTGVLITMIIYFLRARNKQIKLANQLAQSQNLAASSNKDTEIAGLEDLLHELSSSLAQSEQREQQLLKKLQNSTEHLSQQDVQTSQNGVNEGLKMNEEEKV